MGDDELIEVRIVQALPPVHETSVLLGDENIPIEEWKRCLVNANQRIAEIEAALAAFVDASRDRAIYHLRNDGHLRVCHELEAALELADNALRTQK